MECKHLEDAVDISPTFVKKLIHGNRNMWTCSECSSNQSPWMCLKCGIVLCGRYVNGHCLAHGESNENHFVCIDTSLIVFCYKCDDFVINDTSTGTVELIRRALQTEQPRVRERRKRRKVSDAENTEVPAKRLKSYSKENLYRGLSHTLKTVGLRNLGNTCFMNAILQSLSNLKDFSCYFKELPAFASNATDVYIRRYYTRSYQSSDMSLVEELRKIFCALWQGSSTAISPDALFSVVWKVVPRFRGFQQHDAHEFMLYLLNHCHSELLQSRHYNNGTETIVSGMFGGQLQSEVTCLQCGTVSKKKEACLDLSLDIPMKPKETKTKSKKSKTKGKPKVCHLMDCLQRFVEVEELDRSEWYTCNKCGKKEPSTKKFWLLHLPNVLCLHLKRFRYSPNGRTKVDTFVRFPIKELNMNPYLLKKSQVNKYSTKAHIYDLAAVVVHHGSGAGSGHYTTYARHEGSWYHFNDSTVSRTDEDAIVHCKGYILFYTRQYPDINVIGRIKT